MSLKQIASMVGTSVSTVSRVLNNTSPSCASKALQDKIWTAAREIGYQPNEAARQLKKSGENAPKLPRISIVIARISKTEQDPFFSELLRSLEMELLKQKAVIAQIIHTDDSFQENLRDSSGVIILGRCLPELLDRILSQNRNVVGIWRNPMNFDVDEVICDGKKAAELAMRHLLSLGHRQIAYIGDCSYESRYVGYCDTLIQNNIPIDYKLIKQTNQTQDEAETAFFELLHNRSNGKDKFSAIFCANDNTAIRVLELLGRQKPHIRRSISIISIDNIDEAQNTKPFLTTIHIPRQEMAHMAVKLLLDRISKEHKEVVRIEFPCRIIQRDSCYVCERDDSN